MADEAAIRASFAEQAYWCARLGSPFTALLCEVVGQGIERNTRSGRRVLDWPGDPRASADAVALRLCAGLHYLVRRGVVPDLAACYPPAPLPGAAALWAALEPVLDDARLDRWLDSAPQTNEVGRSAVLMSGLLVVAARLGLPIRLYELGASAGLNLLLDQYGHDLGGRRAGYAESWVQLQPEWEGPPPPEARIRVIGRAGADLNPASLPDQIPFLLAYVWPDQPKRLDLLEAALAVAAPDPPRIDRADAADWIEAHLAIEPEHGVARVVLHSVAFQYFGRDSQDRVTRRIEKAGSAATEGAPLAWLRFEKEPDADRYALRLKTWPGEETLLARAHPHGSRIAWLGDH